MLSKRPALRVGGWITLEAIASLAKAEGILLDPVYSAKAFAGMLHDIAAGDFVEGANLLFLFTGGDQAFMPIAAHSISKKPVFTEKLLITGMCR